MVGQARRGTPLRVLLVVGREDDEALVVRELRRGGYEPVCRRAATPDLDLVICDFRLPCLQMLETLEGIRDAGSQAPLVIVSSYDAEDAPERVDLGADALVMKAALSALCAAVERSLKEAERRPEEETLERSEEHFRNAFESAPIGMAMAKPDGRWLRVNKPLCDMLGYTKDELLSTTFQAVTHPEDVDVSSEGMRRLASGEIGSYQLKKRYLHKDGRVVWALLSVSPVRDPQGRPMYGIAHIQDITESERAEEALRESEERFRSAFESAPIGMALVSIEDGSWLEVNRPLCEITGYPEDELLGLTWQEVTHPDDLEADLRQVEQMLGGETRAYQMEKRYVRKDGRVVWVLLSSSLVRDADGEPLYGIAQVQDVTERKRAEEALARSEERLRTIVETEPECVKVLDPEGRLLEMNPAGLAMMEADSIEQLRGRPVYDVVVPEHRAAYEALTNRVLAGGSGTLEFGSVGLKGTWRWLETHAVPLRDAGGRISGLLGITRDTTERRRAEEELRQSEGLYRAVIEQATENIFLVDVGSRRIVESNPAFREALGYSEEELSGMTLYDVVAADKASVDENVRRVLEGKASSVGERRYRRKDGTFLDVEASGSVITRHGRETICAVAHDVTERVRARKLLEERVATISRTAADLTLDLPVQDTLDGVARSVIRASTAVSCSVALLDEETGFLRVEGAHGLPDEFVAGIEEVWQKSLPTSPTLRAIRERRPTLADNMRQRMLENPHYAPVHRSIREAAWDTVFVVPLVSRGRALGAIHLSYLPGKEPEEAERTFLGAVADQAAIAVENARLFSEARGKAALEERQRLARELHDSVSQALYGIALGAKTARDWLAEDPARASDPLEYVLSLAEAGMAEMRALIFELRPESLETEGLVAALEKQAAALRARHGVEVEADLRHEPGAPPETKEALYRIAQEALHNVVKHARASSVRLSMEQDGGRVSLEVSDDGAGFDARGHFPGHLGLRSMRERATRLGGELQVETTPGEGTRVRASIPLRIEESHPAFSPGAR